MKENLAHLDLLKRLSETSGISGNEKRISKIISDELAPVVDEITYDNLGSIIAQLKGKEGAPKVLLTAHMDEIGFLVQKLKIMASSVFIMLEAGGDM